ncbi:hypothetical protein MYX82_07115, partial [Acidobacteria bacterium AH-259-D05]|nr:hypothetical protein [Acidobacteria bacterium AH-259-D05]
ISNILIALLQKSSAYALPILARSDQGGRIQLTNIEAGNYELSIKSSKYRGPARKLIEVLPDKTTVVRLVLQQLFRLGTFEEDNLSVKTLLRTARDGRLIFRHLPGKPGNLPVERPFGLIPGDVVFEVFSSAGLGADYLVFPADAAGGTTTNFAIVQSMGGETRYVLAGQLDSGEDSLWRLKNFVEFPFSDHHSLGVFVGYGRLSFEQPSLALLDNPISLGDNLDYTQASGTTRILSLGFQEKFRSSKALSFLWGLEVDQVDTGHRESFLNPNAEIYFSPTARMQVRLLMAAKRTTYSGSLELPGGDVVNLRDAVYFSRIGDRFTAGSSRHYRSSISQQLTENTEIEFAVYKNRLFGGASSLLAVSDYEPSIQVLNLDDEQAENRGYRVMMKRRFSPTLSTSISYVRGSATGVSENRAAQASAGFAVQELVERRNYHGFATQVDAYIPFSQTHVNALVKFVPNGHPITTLDGFSDIYETGNEGINLFVRQVVPVPVDWLTFLGLDFLSAYRIEALLDIRNLTNENLGTIAAGREKISLVRNPRTVRGGISVRF